ncbi:hypothetical protein MRX96_054393 [Rhipicephalus microplus]
MNHPEDRNARDPRLQRASASRLRVRRNHKHTLNLAPTITTLSFRFRYGTQCGAAEGQLCVRTWQKNENLLGAYLSESTEAASNLGNHSSCPGFRSISRFSPRLSALSALVSSHERKGRSADNGLAGRRRHVTNADRKITPTASPCCVKFAPATCFQAHVMVPAYNICPFSGKRLTSLCDSGTTKRARHDAIGQGAIRGMCV